MSVTGTRVFFAFVFALVSGTRIVSLCVTRVVLSGFVTHAMSVYVTCVVSVYVILLL